jgi:lyso-ornithine lipid O-acyltransferase
MPGFMRGLLRGAIFPGIAARAFAEYCFTGARRSLASRVEWLQHASILHGLGCGLTMRVSGEVPTGGLIVANHISYLDIIALSTVTRCAFVSKREIGTWPLFGTYAKMGATIFVDRERRGDVADVAADMRTHLDAGIPLVLFPEGTSSDSTCVLPFRSSLFEPVVKLTCPLTACGLRYEIEEGSVRDDVAYWGDTALLPHLLNLITKRRVTAFLHFGTSRVRNEGRKTLARELREEVCALAGISPDAQMSTPLTGIPTTLMTKR